MVIFNGNLRLEKLGGTDVRTYGWTEGRMEIHPCVLRDISPLKMLPKKVTKKL